jgi:hypothetical protein
VDWDGFGSRLPLGKFSVVLSKINAISPKFLNPTWLRMAVGNAQHHHRNDSEYDRKRWIDPNPQQDDQTADYNNPRNLSECHGADP